MKKQIKTILCSSLFILVAGVVTSCTSYLDKEPASTFDPETIYKNFYNYQGATEELYNCIPDFANKDNNNFFNLGDEEFWQVNAASQNAFCANVDNGNFWEWAQTGYGACWFNNGNFQTDNERRNKGLWPGCWYGIRKANMLLANLNKLEGTQAEKDLIAGQCYFFRGWFYFQLIQYWGGMPYITHEIPSDQKPTYPRLKYSQCADSIDKDLNRAYELLPNEWDKIPQGLMTQNKNELRINKWMALAYLGKNSLWAGSPLMNMASGGAEEYNKTYCKKAADYLGTLLDSCATGQCKYKLVPFSKYSDLYYNSGQSGRLPGSATVGSDYYVEAIFRGPNYGGSNVSMQAQYLCAGSVLDNRSWSLYPTANYVNYFGMANGLPINDQNKADVADPVSGYDVNYPWKNRDPRFYINFGFDTQKQVNSTSSTDAKKFQYANLYTGGNYRNPTSGSNTGYLLMKFDPLGFNKYDNGFNNVQIHPAWLRLAEVYLMYAEAAAIANGTDAGAAYATSSTSSMKAYEAINVVRDRAGVGHVADKYLSSLSGFMSEVRRERAVELAYEGHRFNDLRRWHLLAKYPYNTKTKIEFDRVVTPIVGSDGVPTNNFTDKTVPQNNKIINLKESVLFERNYSEKHYWFPLTQKDASMYMEFYQNPGW